MTNDDSETSMDVVPAVPATPLPYLTADLPGVGGVIKRVDEDFVVEEVPLYPALGAGTHWYLTIEKRGLTTLEAVRRIGQALGVASRQIGYAGLKDAHAVTRQRISVEHVERRRIEGLDVPGIEVVKVEQHTNKIKLGHLAGNRFRIRIRDARRTGAEARPTTQSPGTEARSTTQMTGEEGRPIMHRDPLPRVGAIMAVLSRRGAPNYFGPQRFGVRGDNARIGIAVLRDEYDEAIAMMLGRPSEVDRPDFREARALFDAGEHERAMAAWPGRFAEQKRVARVFVRSGGDARKAWLATAHPLRKLLISAVQSELFNRVLASRIGALDRVVEGDVAWKHANGACFQVEDLAAEQARCEAFDISPTGPMFGKRMKSPGGRPGEIEADVLARSGLTVSHFRPRDGVRLDGERRPLRVPLLEPSVQSSRDGGGSFVELHFTLPPGAYATCVTREVCKGSG